MWKWPHLSVLLPDELQEQLGMDSTHTCTNLFCIIFLPFVIANSQDKLSRLRMGGWGCFRSLIRRHEGRCPNKATNDVVIEFASIQDRGER